MSASVTITPPAEQGAGAPTGGRDHHFSDRLNAILIRDVIQSLNGKSFLGVLVLVLLAVFGIAAVSAWTLRNGGNVGRSGFRAAMGVLTPLLTFIVPSQAFYATRMEMRGGTAELLLLSGLTPAAIVRGRMLAAFTQALLWVSVFAPVIAMTYLLRGVSIPDVLTAIGMALVFNVAATSLGVALGTLAKSGAVGGIVNGIVGIALGAATIPMVAFTTVVMYEIRGGIGAGGATEFLGSLVLLLAAATVLLALIAQSQLTHPHENRSTGFRVYFVAAAAAAVLWAAYIAPPSALREALMGAPTIAVGFGSLFFVFAVTEDEAFTSRHRLNVPKNPVLALLALPLLPGRGRGLIYSVLCLATAWCVAEILPGVLGLRPPFSTEIVDIVRLVPLYVAFYTCLAFTIRRFFAPGMGRCWLARIVWLVTVVVLWVGPLLVQLLVIDRHSGWTHAQVLNPFWTIANLRSGSDDACILMSAIAGLFVVLSLLPAVRSVRETLFASAARREREARAS